MAISGEMNVKIRVVREGQSIVFELSKSIGFDFFVISNAEERVFWELKPVSMQPLPVLEADIFGMRAAPAAQREMKSKVTEIAGSRQLPENPPVTRIVYGEVPTGYREVVRASPLKGGEKYCALLVGDGFEKGGEYFFG
jgi:hypothetical protein